MAPAGAVSISGAATHYTRVAGVVGGAVLEAAKALLKARRAFAFTGAGISAESGIPTFRGGSNSLWGRFDPRELATPEAFARDPLKVWKWYAWRIELVLKARPNPAHKALAELERMGVIEAVVTQNVDGLHQRAGSRRVVELHGNILRVRCSRAGCGFRATLSEPPKELPPRCPRCGGLLRPDVVWFGEPLPPEAWREAEAIARSSDAVLVVGTSGVVYPAAYIPLMVREGGGVIIEVNVEPSAITPYATIFIRGKASEALPKLVELVRELAGT